MEMIQLRLYSLICASFAPVELSTPISAILELRSHANCCFVNLALYLSFLQTEMLKICLDSFYCRLAPSTIKLDLCTSIVFLHHCNSWVNSPLKSIKCAYSFSTCNLHFPHNTFIYEQVLHKSSLVTLLQCVTDIFQFNNLKSVRPAYCHRKLPSKLKVKYQRLQPWCNWLLN